MIRHEKHSNATKKGMEPWIAFYKQYNLLLMKNESTKMLRYKERRKLIADMWKLHKENKKNYKFKNS